MSEVNYQLVNEKVEQAVQILQEQDVDLWLTLVRETSAGGDPVLPFVLGHDVTWQSAFLLTRNGERIAIMGHYDAENARKSGAYSEVVGYHHAFSEPLRATLQRLNPRQASIVESRFFGGLEVAETAQFLGVSEATVARDWRVAKAWLSHQLSKNN